MRGLLSACAVRARLRKDMRAAVLASKRAIDAQQVSRREELLRSSAVREKQTLNEKVTCVHLSYGSGQCLN